jgi:hypothetical protein
MHYRQHFQAKKPSDESSQGQQFICGRRHRCVEIAGQVSCQITRKVNINHLIINIIIIIFSPYCYTKHPGAIWMKSDFEQDILLFQNLYLIILKITKKISITDPQPKLQAKSIPTKSNWRKIPTDWGSASWADPTRHWYVFTTFKNTFLWVSTDSSLKVTTLKNRENFINFVLEFTWETTAYF